MAPKNEGGDKVGDSAPPPPSHPRKGKPPKPSEPNGKETPSGKISEVLKTPEPPYVLVV
jgi:hypothetical protein